MLTIVAVYRLPLKALQFFPYLPGKGFQAGIPGAHEQQYAVTG
jgi:hypothetical protein